MVNAKKLIITILLKKEFIKKELPCYYNILCKYKNKKYYYYNIPNTKKIIKSNMKIQKINKMLLENMLALDANLYKKIKNTKGYKFVNKNKKSKIMKNKSNMLTVQTVKPQSPKVMEPKNKIESTTTTTNSMTSSHLFTSTIIPNFDENEKKFHYRSKSVTFVEDSLEQIRLFNIFDPPNNINMTPTHYSTGKINSHSLLKYHKRQRNDTFKIQPFSNTELKENALYDHPLRRHRPNSKFNMPYNLKMDFSFGDPILPSPTSPSNSSSVSTTPVPAEKLEPSEKEEISFISTSANSELPELPKSPLLSKNYIYSSEEGVKTSLSFASKTKDTLYNPSLLSSITSNEITSLPQLV